MKFFVENLDKPFSYPDMLSSIGLIKTLSKFRWRSSWIFLWNMFIWPIIFWHVHTIQHSLSILYFYLLYFSPFFWKHIVYSLSLLPPLDLRSSWMLNELRNSSNREKLAFNPCCSLNRMKVVYLYNPVTRFKTIEFSWYIEALLWNVPIHHLVYITKLREIFKILADIIVRNESVGILPLHKIKLLWLVSRYRIINSMCT